MNKFEDTFPTQFGCQDQCRQGRKKCPCPQACEMPEEEMDKYITRVVWVMISAVLFALWVAFFWG